MAWVSSLLARTIAVFQRMGLPWAGLIAAVVALLVSLSSPWRVLELKFYDRLVVATAPGEVSLPITIIGIDEASFADLKKQWPWPRSLHAKLLDRLREAKVAVVAFDVLFAEPSSVKEDKAFAKAIKSFGGVVLAADMVYSETSGVRQWIRVDPEQKLVSAGAVSGLASVQLDPDGVQRQFPISQDAFWRKVLLLLDKKQPGVITRIEATPDMRIRYLGGPQTFTYIPYYQLLNPGKYLPDHWRDFLKDNIVLVGRNLRAAADVGSAQADMFQTPFMVNSQELMPGVEIHANMIANMISGNVLREAHRSWVWLLWAGTSLLSLLLMRRWQPLKSGLVALVLLTGIAAGDYALFTKSMIWLPAAGAMLSVTLIFLAQGGVAYFIEQHKRRQIKQAFSMYVAPAVVERVIADPSLLKLGGERRELTLLFTDLAGFTSISESLDAEQVAKLLNRHFTEMTEIVMRYHGTVDKFIGDAVMAFWGAPIADEGQSTNAVRAAVEMQEKIAVMRRDLVAEGGADLHMRIGIHRGECIVGNLGGDTRFDYTAIGDTVNLASRLEGVNKVYGTEILCSEIVMQALEGKIPMRHVDTVRVKGKHQGVGIFTPCHDAQLVTFSEVALALYRDGEWELSRKKWQELLDSYPGDSVAEVFMRRLDNFSASGWPQDWDGVTTLETK